MVPLKVTDANKGPLITPSGFKNYDVGMNPYVGCQFGCKYCYVRFMVKDDEAGWGDFVRLRKHITTKLPKEIAKLSNKRLVIGTMTDPYQPIERKERLTRETLNIIVSNPGHLTKVGIFTRSPIVLDDLELIKKLPRPRVHFTITPFELPVLQKIEPIAIPIKRRLETIQAIQQAGIRIQANLSPILPCFSEMFLEDTIATLSQIGVDEFYIDPMQPYKEALTAMDQTFGDDANWRDVKAIMSDKERYVAWKKATELACIGFWQKHDNGKTFAIWQDHVTKYTIDMRTGEELDRKHYGEDKE